MSTNSFGIHTKGSARSWSIVCRRNNTRHCLSPAGFKFPAIFASAEDVSLFTFFCHVIATTLGFSVWPHYFMKIYTARDINTLKKTVVFYPTFQIFLVPIMLIGFAGIHTFSRRHARGLHPPHYRYVDGSARTVGGFFLRRGTSRLDVRPETPSSTLPPLSC